MSYCDCRCTFATVFLLLMEQKIVEGPLFKKKRKKLNDNARHESRTAIHAFLRDVILSDLHSRQYIKMIV